VNGTGRDWNRIGRPAKGAAVVAIILGALVVLITAVSASGSTPSAVSSNSACAPTPSPTGTGYWTLFGDSSWTGDGLLTSSKADPSAPYGVTCGGASVYGQSLPTTNPHQITALSFDFNPSLSGPSGSSPRLVVCFSDNANCNSNGSLAPTEWTAGTWTHVDGFASPGAWSSTGGSCGNTYNVNWAAIVACHAGASIVQVAVVNDSGSLYRSGEQVLLNNMTVNNVTAHATAPILGQRATVAPSNGTVLVKRPGAHHFSNVKTVTSVPYGSIVNANTGKLKVIAAKGSGGTESGVFYAGSFQMTQNKAGLVNAILTHRPQGCPSDKTGASTARSHSFNLWSHVKGKFRTRGAYGSASVRGTIWLTENRCDGTYFRVIEGTLWIRDFTRHKSVILRAGHSYLAPNALPSRKDRDGDQDGD
jgi:hypothetical protein